MTENTILGVSIPTYKRPDELRKCVQSILKSARPRGVPVYLVDDSTDDTNQALFAELQDLYPFIHVVTNERNLGIDRNIQKAADVCPCEYVWLLGEDDRMRPDGVSVVLDALETCDIRPPFVYVNYSATDNDVSFLIKERSLPLTENLTVPADRFYRDYAWSMGFIGACVIRKAAWDPVDPRPYLDSYFAHVGRIIESIRGQEVLMIADPLILNRCGTPEAFSWTGDALGVFVGWKKMTDALNTVYSPEDGEASLRTFRRAHGIGSLKFLAYLRADGVFHAGMVDQLAPRQQHGPVFRFLAHAIARLPCWPWRMARAALMKLRQTRSPSLPVSA